MCFNGGTYEPASVKQVSGTRLNTVRTSPFFFQYPADVGDYANQHNVYALPHQQSDNHFDRAPDCSREENNGTRQARG